jgi:hypothetical protein
MNSGRSIRSLIPLIDPVCLRQFADISECLLNLIYLTQLEADHPDLVRKYMNISEERMKAMVEVLRKQVPNDAPAVAVDGDSSK